MSAVVKLLWHRGSPLESVLPKMEGYAASNDLVLAGWGGLGYAPPGAERVNCYRLTWNKGGKLSHESLDRPWECRPLASAAFQRLSWQFLYRGETWLWMTFWGKPEGDDCTLDGKLRRLVISFEEEPDSWDLTKDEAARAIRKYHQMWDLFSELDCDAVEGYSDSFCSGGTDMDDDPGHEQEIFRFAKEGRQVLLVPMEEHRARRVGEYDWRLVVDP